MFFKIEGISQDLVQKAHAKIRPIDEDDVGVLRYLKADAIDRCYTWNKIFLEPAENLREVQEIDTFHMCDGWSFMPTPEEVLAIILYFQRRGELGHVDAYKITDEVEGGRIGTDEHSIPANIAKTVLYKKV